MPVKLDIDFAKAIKVAEKMGEKVVQGTMLDLFGKTVKRTPVGNPSIWEKPNSAPPGYVGGRLRANWQFSVHVPATGEVSGVAVPNASADVAGFKFGNKAFMTNNLPYAMAVEMGHSALQAPAGMVRVTMREFIRDLERHARSNK